MSKISLLFKSLISSNYNTKDKNKQHCVNSKNIINNKISNSGFSLLELSIVLIIIGILIIGVIRGYALMTASRIITLTNELTQYSFAAEQFSAKYGNLPGIIDNPQKILGNTAKSKIDDEKIDTNAINESASITNAESINFFNHLYLSGLLGESSAPFVGTNEDLSSKSEITKDSNYYPRLKSIKSMFIYVRGDDIDGNYNKLNRLTVSNYSNGILGINADLIFGLDNKVDDGLPLSGLISIVPMKISNYGSSDKSSSYNNNRNNNTQIASINNVIDYYLMSSKSINSFNIINTANAENGNTKSNNSSTSCLVLDKSANEIKYNTKGKNCFILRNIDSTQQNKITDLGLSGTTGESCNLLNKDDYPNAESVAGTTILNGSKKTIKCNDGYTGNITITCNEGEPIHSGDTKCTFNGCKKYDNNVINSSLNAILTTNDVVNWDNIDETEKNNLSTNSDISYSKNDIITTLSCKEKDGYKLKEGSNGYTIKCDGNDNIVVESNGGCEYIPNEGCLGLPKIDERSILNSSSIGVHKRSGCSIRTTATNIIYDDSNFSSYNAGSYSLEYLQNKRFVNNTIIDVGCKDGYQEHDGCDGNDSDLSSCRSNYSAACWYWHYYECKNNQWIARGGCRMRTCSVSSLTSDILGSDSVKTITSCTDNTCNTLHTDSIVDITLEENKHKTYNFGTIITLNSCNAGYSIPENKRIIRCNESGKWEIYNNTESNTCVFNGCNDMSAVFDKNGNKVSEQLYNMTFGSGNTSTTVYPLKYCVSGSATRDIIKLSTLNEFVVDNNGIAYCADSDGISNFIQSSRLYTCMADTTNINNGNSYWKYDFVSCDLSTIKNIDSYIAYLNTEEDLIASLNEKTTQYRYFSNSWNKLYTNKSNDFTLSCNSSGNWEMIKTANSCSGAPTLISGSSFYKNDSNISYVENQLGMLMNTSTLSNDTSTLTKTKLSNTNQYFVTNGTKIEANCVSGSIEVDKNNVAESDSSADKGGHYYECVNGTWTARGGCQVKLDYYSPKLYDDINNTGNIALTKNVKVGDVITCDFESFGISDPNSGTLKICAINGYRVAVDGESFTVSVPTNHTFCHKSYIPRDLGVGLNGSAGVDGWCDDWITNDTYKGVGANVSNGSSFVTGHNDTNVSTSTTLVCNNGTWKVGSGSMVFEYSGSVKTFCAPYGLKDAGKSITFELWGAQGGGSYGGEGGYTKGVLESNNYNNSDTFYVVVGEQGGTVNTFTASTNSFNGGGYSMGLSTNSTHVYVGGGGGATHVATSIGQLSTLSKSTVLLVAGGGGGGFDFTISNYYSNKSGGVGGGGNNGGSNGYSGVDNDYGIGGSLSSAGYGMERDKTSLILTGSFGKGGNCTYTSNGEHCNSSYCGNCTGGGAGYYGGGASRGGDACGGAGGGSGYCNTSKFTCSGSNGQRSGNGRVVISW